MDITPVIPEGRQIIKAYGAGGFTVNDQHFTSSVLVFPHQTQEWLVTSVEKLTEVSFDAVLKRKDDIEILLLGTGAKLQQPNPTIRAKLRMHGISLDIMDTGAACRTYNILLAEGRRLAAALIKL